MHTRHRIRRIPLALAIVAAATACSSEPTASAERTVAPAVSEGAPYARAGAATEARDLATLRAATARFHRFDVAFDAGYTDLFQNRCIMDPSGLDRGGMGWHYVNPQLLDAVVEVDSPEALLYETGPNGELRLTGVEYVIPAGLWTSASPPTLHGRDFVLNPFGLWALHVWAWKDNPSGVFADWNPRVACP